MSETKKVYPAILAVMDEMAKVGIAKARENKAQGFNFRGIDDVYAALGECLVKHKLVILPRMVSHKQQDRMSGAGKPLIFTTVEAEYDFVSTEDGSMHVVKTCGEAQDSADKSTNKAMSAAYKYMAFQAFCIPLEGKDADETGEETRSVVDSAVIEANLKAIREAGDMKALEKAYETAVAYCNEAADGAALKSVVTATNARKKDLKNAPAI